MRTKITAGWLAGLISVCAVGCAVDADDGEKYREPLPAQGSVALDLPGSSSASNIGTKDLKNGSGGSTAVSDAEYYEFTRNLTNAIDGNSAFILGAIWSVAQTPPTTIESNRAVWGPSQGNALEPTVWRLLVTEVATGEFDYALEARAKASTNDADFKAIVKGQGFGKTHPKHLSGWFQFDNEALRSLDPAHAKDRGTAKVEYDLRQLPRTIAVALRPNDGTGDIDAKVEHRSQGAGVLTVNGVTDIESDGQEDGKHETIALKSQWNSSGAGRADVSISGGSLPIASVDIVECWSTSFSRAYYKDSVNFKAMVGAESACPTLTP